MGGLRLCFAALALCLLSPSLVAQTANKAGAKAPAAPLPAGQIDTLRRIRDTGVILIGVREASVPFSFLDANKSPQGYSVDICLKVADAIKAELKVPRLEVRFVRVSSADRIPMVLEGKIDLECGSTTNTRDRQKQVAFAYTTFVAGIKMLVKKSSNISGIEDLRGKTIVVTKGTTSEKIMSVKNDEQLLGLNIIVAADHNESLRMVEEGKAVAFPMDDVLLYGLISKSKKPDDFAVVGKYLSVEPYAIMMRRDEPQLERVINKALSDLFASGEIRKLYAKWFATRELTVPMNQFIKEAFLAPNTHPAWP
jgi:glutamate/aspartate transport system substrate-binding protein